MYQGKTIGRNVVKLTFGTSYLLLVVILAYNVFFLVPWGFVEGGFNVADVALALIWIGVIGGIIYSRQLPIWNNPVSWLVLSYLLIVAMHVSLAAINYGQPLFNGVVAARYQYFYGFYFLCLFLLKDVQRIGAFLNVLTVISLIVYALALVNYLGPTILYHEKAEDWIAIRAGIQRIFIPHMPLINMAFFWQFAGWLTKNRLCKYAGLQTLLLSGAIIFQQSRASILGTLIVVFAILLFYKKYKILFVGTALGVMVIGLASVVMQENILLQPFSGTAHFVQEEEGTKGGRISQFELDFDEFIKHPFIGSGLVAIRVSELDRLKRGDFAERTRTADLGYTHWIKNFGIVGIIWVIAFLYVLLSTGIRLLNNSDGELATLSLFATAYVAFVGITMITLNHLMVKERIIVLCLVAALLTRLRMRGSSALVNVESRGR